MEQGAGVLLVLFGVACYVAGHMAGRHTERQEQRRTRRTQWDIDQARGAK
jgi:hypothetical protein